MGTRGYYAVPPVRGDTADAGPRGRLLRHNIPATATRYLAEKKPWHVRTGILARFHLPGTGVVWVMVSPGNRTLSFSPSGGLSSSFPAAWRAQLHQYSPVWTLASCPQKLGVTRMSHRCQALQRRTTASRCGFAPSTCRAMYFDISPYCDCCRVSIPFSYPIFRYPMHMDSLAWRHPKISRRPIKVEWMEPLEYIVTAFPGVGRNAAVRYVGNWYRVRSPVAGAPSRLVQE